MNIKYSPYSIGEVWYDQAGNKCYYRDNGTLAVVTENLLPTMTIQSEKDSCDINKIVAKFKTTGLMSNVRNDQPMFGDFSNITDYQGAVIQSQLAEDAFMILPASLRKRFDNDPGKLIDFLDKIENRSEAIKLGLIANDSLEVHADGQQLEPVQEEAGQSST